MIVLPEMTMRELMTQIVGATHGLTDSAGEPQVMSTIPEAQLRMAAVMAVSMAVGQVVWPQVQKVVLKRRKADFGIFEEER